MSQQQPTQSPNSTPLQSIQQRGADKTGCSESDKGWIFHRNREQPTPDSNEPPLNQIKFYLDRYRIKEALQIFFDENTLRLLHVESDFMWDIIPIICKRLRGLCQYRFRVFEGCERMLCRIAVEENCNPKEVLISLLAEVSQHDRSEDDNVFRAMIRPLEGTLLRMTYPSPREENFRWVLSVLMRHLNDIEVPQEYNLEGKKRLALSNDPNVKRFIEVLPPLLSFIEEFNDRPIDYDKSPMPVLTESQIDEVFNGELIDDDLISDCNPSRLDSSDASVVALLATMHRPLTFLDLTTYCNDLKLFANRCLNMLLKLRPNLFSPIYSRISKNSSHNDADFMVNGTIGACNESAMSLATCSYLYQCERVVTTGSVQNYPQVITHESMLLCHIPYIVGLLERSEILVHEKGLMLLEHFLRKLESNSLDQSYLEVFKNSSLDSQLFRIMVFSPLCSNRRRAFDMFTCLCDLLNYECKLKMFKYVMAQSDLRPCIRAASIDLYRKYLTIIYRDLITVQQTSPQSHQLASLPDSDGSNFLKMSIEKSDTSRIWEAPTSNNECGEASEDASNQQPHRAANSAIGSKLDRRAKILRARYNVLGGHALVEFLEHCVEACLPDSQHTDIIENYELLLATLTMFRFLKLRKGTVKNPLEEEYLNDKKLKKLFFDPIRSAINLIMSELKLHHKEVVEGHRIKSMKPASSILNQSRNEYNLLSRVLGPKLEELIGTPGTEFGEKDETDCLNWALCRLDLVESVLVRTCDLFDW